MRAVSGGPDEVLVVRLLRGDEDAFRTLFRAHAGRLVLLGQRLLADRAEAEDAVQETFLRALRQLPGFRREAALSTWLSGILVNCCREALRRRRPADALSDELPGPPREGAGGVDLERALRELPDGFREVLVLHDVEGYTHEEIGALLGIEPGTARSQLSRARARMRERLSGGTS